MACLDGKYGSASLPKSKNAEIELVYQVLWQPPPARRTIVIQKELYSYSRYSC